MAKNTRPKYPKPALWESVRDVNEPDDRGRTLLYVSARRRDVSFVTKALAQSSGDTVDITNRAGKRYAKEGFFFFVFSFWFFSRSFYTNPD